MKQSMKKTMVLRRRQGGLTTVETIILLCLVAVVCYSAWNAFGNRMRSTLNDRTEQTARAPGVFE
jgi:hypothetical protein